MLVPVAAITKGHFVLKQPMCNLRSGGQKSAVLSVGKSEGLVPVILEGTVCFLFSLLESAYSSGLVHLTSASLLLPW